MSTIQLIGVGTVEAIPACEVKVGDERLYNYYGTSVIVKIIEKSAKTLTFITYSEEGKYYITDIRKSTLVAINQTGLDVSMHTPNEAYSVKKRDMVDVSEHFPIIEEVAATIEEEVTNEPQTIEEAITALDEVVATLSTEDNTDKINHSYTDKYPLRYESQANQDTVYEKHKVSSDSFDHTGGEELFTYYNTYPYENKTNRKGYISVTISSYQGTKFILEIEAEYPDRMKYTNHSTKVFETYTEAREWAVIAISELKQWIHSKWWNKLPEVEIEEAVYNNMGSHYKMTTPDGTPIIYIVGDHNRHVFNIPQTNERDCYYYKVRFKEKEIKKAV